MLLNNIITGMLVVYVIYLNYKYGRIAKVHMNALGHLGNMVKGLLLLSACEKPTKDAKP